MATEETDKGATVAQKTFTILRESTPPTSVEALEAALKLASEAGKAAGEQEKENKIPPAQK